MDEKEKQEILQIRKAISNTIKNLEEQFETLEKKVDKLMLEKGLVTDNEEMPYVPIFKGKKALVGNYDYFSSEQTKKILESFGMDVEVVKTSTAIIDKIKSGEKYDIIFTNNIYQIGITGPELLKELRALAGFDTPVVIHTIDIDRRSYYVDELGFDEYIAKPIIASDKNKILEIQNILQKLLL